MRVQHTMPREEWRPIAGYECLYEVGASCLEGCMASDVIAHVGLDDALVNIVEVVKLSLASQDILVLRMDSLATTTQINQIREVMGATMARAGLSNQIVIMDGGLNVVVIHPTH
jgi:hypothetical protein